MPPARMESVWLVPCILASRHRAVRRHLWWCQFDILLHHAGAAGQCLPGSPGQC